MRIYIVTSGEYSDYSIDAVFTDKLQAELYAATHNCDRIEEYESDQCVFETNKKPRMHWRGIWEKRSKYGLCNKIKFWYLEGTYGLGDVDEIVDEEHRITIRISTDTDVDKEKAKKIIFDKFYQWFYRQVETEEMK